MDILEFKNISKTFSGVKVLNNINLSIKKGEVHALCGENGAGKSTLMKILSGVYTPDSDGGSLLIEGKEIQDFSPIAARGNGVSIIYQELDLIPFLNVAENIVLSAEPKTKSKLFIDRKESVKRTKELFERLGVNIPLSAKIRDLSVGQQQMVMIAKAISYNAKILIMDEPSAALGEDDVEHMLKIVRTLKDQGISIIYISHRLEEIFKIADRFSVLRDGQLIVTGDVAEANKSKLISYMIGREIVEEQRNIKPANKEKTVLEIKDLNNEKLYNINLKLYEGEILGIAGLVGAGRSELARAVYGADPIVSGEIILNGKKIKKPRVQDAIKNRIGFVPEDRKTQGLLMNFNIRQNSTLANLKTHYLKKGIINKKLEKTEVENIIKKLNVKPANQDMMVKRMSGGNQQKVVLAKWLLTDCNVLIIDEPTRGIDVGAKEEIYNLLYELKERGISIMVISSELPEVLKISDRIVVMANGKISGVIDREEKELMNELSIMKLAHME